MWYRKMDGEYVVGHRYNIGTATMCVFPECGNGYFEWSAFVRMRRETNVLHNVQRIVMMDSHMKDDWLLPWREIARLSNVRLDVAKSYSDLVDIIPCSGEVGVVVVYIKAVLPVLMRHKARD
jgi:hypothetical protein